MKQIVLAAVLALFAPAARAEIPCGDTYESAARLLDDTYREYGTLYEGGHGYDSIGGTLEIYRLLSGLPDSGMANRRPSGAPYIDPPGNWRLDPDFAGQTLLRGLTRLHDPEFRRDTDAGSTDTEVLLNLLTPVGPYPGWWLTPDAPQLSSLERVIAAYAFDDGLDWLLTVEAASAMPHTQSWHANPYRGYYSYTQRPALEQHSLGRYADSEALTWFVAAHLTRVNTYAPRNDPHAASFSRVEAHYDALEQNVAACTASSAEYVAYSIALLERTRLEAAHYRYPDLTTLHVLPPTLRLLIATQLAKQVVAVPGYSYYRDRGPSPESLRALANDPAFDRWFNVGRSYRAATLDELIAVNDGVPLDPKVIRLLNVLSADDLLRFAAARADDPTETRIITTAAFLRLFALHRDDEAAALLGAIQTLWPEQAAQIGQIWSGGGTQGYRLAKIALALPNGRTLLVPYAPDWRTQGMFDGALQHDGALRYWSADDMRRGRDLPFAIRSGNFLARDFGFWMQAIGTNAYYRTIRRANRRDLPFPDLMERVPPVLPTSTLWNLGFGTLVASQELAALGPETGLANRIGVELVLHARTRTRSLLTRLMLDQEALARDLQIVVLQGRRMIQGDMEGRPLGQVAFTLLHGRLGNTAIADQTPYWYICRERCEP